MERSALGSRLLHGREPRAESREPLQKLSTNPAQGMPGKIASSPRVQFLVPRFASKITLRWQDGQMSHSRRRA